MNSEQSRTLIKETFMHAFDKGRFLNFARNLLNRIDETKGFSRNSQYIKDAFRDHVQRFERLGTYTTPKKETLDVLVVHVTTGSKLERARTAIRNFVADHLKDRDEKDAALVAFVSPDKSTWRFSYVKMEYATVQKELGKVGVEARLTPARRFSYLVGEGESCHTAQTRFLDLLQNTEADATLDEIEEAFSVEAVTKEFFSKYAELFGDINAELEKLVAQDKAIRDDFTVKSVNTVDFAKKLIGQIVFLYFLQKKGWLGVPKDKIWGSGPRDFLRRLAKGEYGAYKNFFNDLLEPLFYDTLATDRGHEAWCNRLKCRIPFLNGGLFEPLGKYNWQKTDIILPNKLFTNSDFVDDGITGTGVLDVFDRYNFTVNEAEPLEQEVAIDPEMLGKVFENLIEENRRKGLGSYYTPREIVHYMCQESLIDYLDSAVNDEKELVPRSDIEMFVHLGEQISHYESVDAKYPVKMPKTIQEYARQIDERLAAITVCDPAVGSGAFPVGMMTEIVRARCALTPYFNDVHERMPYYFKRHAIQNSLYGVDIDAGAIEIAKLRLWLSLVVDEEDDQQIKPLPNLDYKVVPGNSLFGVKQHLFNAAQIRDLEELKPLYFDESDRRRKESFKERIDTLIEELTNGKAVFDIEIHFSEVFHKNRGFDVFIGNPPYIRIQNIDPEDAQVLKQQYKSASGKFDIYVLFVEAAFRSINSRGSIILIHPHRFLTADYGKGFKAFLDEIKGLHAAILFGVEQVFETSTTYTGIFSYRKNNESFLFKYVKTRDFRAVPFKARPYTKDGNHWILATERAGSADFVVKLKSQTRALTDVFEGIYQGIVTVGDDIFVLRGRRKGNIFFGHSAAAGDVKIEADLVKPLVKGEHIRRYGLLDSELGIIYPHHLDERGRTVPYSEKELKAFFPLAYEYFKPFKKHLVEKKIHYKTNPEFWFSLHRAREMQIFDGRKIITPQLQNMPHFTIDEKGWYPDAGGYSLLRRSTQDDEFFLLGVLNSRVLWYFIKNTSNPYNNSYYYFKTKYLEPFSMPQSSRQNQMAISDLVRKVLELHKEEGPAGKSAVPLEREVDNLVYELYGLSTREIRIVEESAPW